MPILEWKRKITKHGNSITISIPPALCEGLKFGIGDKVIISLNDEHIEIRKVDNIETQ